MLKQLLQLDPETNMVIDKPAAIVQVTDPMEGASFNEIYKQALNTLPEVKANELNIKSAELDVDIAKANMIPTLTLSGSLATNFSSAFKSPVFTGQTARNGQTVFIDGNQALLETESPVINFTDKSYLDQVNDNFGQGVSLGLNVPIFNGRQAKINIDRSKLQIENLKVQRERTLNQIKSDVQRALNDARAAKLQLEASTRSLDAQKVNYDNVDKRYNLGAVSTFEYITAKNNLDAAQFNESISKYDYIFKAKVLDFYLGKRLTIN